MIVNCVVCGRPFDRPSQRGRPAIRCPECRKNNLQPTDRTTSATTAAPQVSTITTDTPEAFSIKEKVVIPFRATTYQVLVGGGIGTVYSGESEKEALIIFSEYEKKSASGFGQVGFECVQLWRLNSDTKTYESQRLFKPHPIM